MTLKPNLDFIAGFSQCRLLHGFECTQAASQRLHPAAFFVQLNRLRINRFTQPLYLLGPGLYLFQCGCMFLYLCVCLSLQLLDYRFYRRYIERI